MRIDPLLTSNPVTGAVRFITDELLGENYLAPKADEPDLFKTLQARTAPWSASLKAAPAETTRAVETALVSVARSTPTLDPAELDISALPDCRAKTHLAALKELWQDLDRLPSQLAKWAHVIGSDAHDALEPLPILNPTPCPFADPVEIAVAETLVRHHGVASTASQHEQAKAVGPAHGNFGAIQRQMGKASEKTTRDASVACFGLRDPREEAQFAAALAQRLIDDGRVAGPAEIGILCPEDPAYSAALQESCDTFGLPLSGGAETPAKRDFIGELLSLALQLLSAPAPRTALASFYISPLMPWPCDVGRQMAREVMDYGWSKTANEVTGAERDMLDALTPSHTPEQLFARLNAIAKALADCDLQPRIAPLRAVTADQLDWTLLHKLAAPVPAEAEGQNRFVEGVSLFTETALPWRPVRQLMVLGMTGNRWPNSPGSDPFFTEGEVALIRENTGLCLQGRRERLARGLELFRRQLCAGTDGLTLLASSKNLRGETLSPSTGLALISHMLGAEKPSDLVHDVRNMPVEEWPVAARIPAPLPQNGAVSFPSDGVLELNRGLGTPDKPGLDLLRVRQDEDGRMLPQSPSRLENVIVSPLAWLLEELDARDRTWAPESLDVMTLGTIIHQVLEDAFPENSDVPTSEDLERDIPVVLDAAIGKHAKWLGGPSWATERKSLLGEALDVSKTWAGFLSDTGANVLHNEIDLAGDHGGLLLRGKSDCLLRLPDGRILVVDHKRSSASNRRDRMTKGWDLQVALYRAMLERPEGDTALTKLVEDGVQIVTAYHTTRDATVLSDELGVGLDRVEAIPNDVSEHAMSHLAEVVAEVGAGTVRLNREGDYKRFEKERGIKAYALEGNPLVAAFTLPKEDRA